MYRIIRNRATLFVLKQAFNIRIQDSGIEDGDMNLLTLPTETFGLAIPQVLSETEKACMKNAVHTFMSTRFSVSATIIYITLGISP
jgi:hypothetical protein